jgi:hypothetical protein
MGTLLTPPFACLRAPRPPFGTEWLRRDWIAPDAVNLSDIAVRHVQEGFVLEVAWEFRSLVPLADGDTYSVTVTSADDRSPRTSK